MKKFFIAILILSFFYIDLSAQSYAFGVKGGLTIGTQTYGSFSRRDPLFAFHGDVFIETAPEGNEFALFAQTGWHVRGSSIIRPRFIDQSGNLFNGANTRYEYRNIALVLGAKQKFDIGQTSKTFYSFGIRGEYTLNTNLNQFSNDVITFRIYHPLDAFVRKLNYGLYLSGGFEFPFSDFVSGIFEVALHPDFSLQYRQPPIDNVFDPYTGQDRNYAEQLVRNNSLEVSLGFRFLRIIEYVDTIDWGEKTGTID